MMNGQSAFTRGLAAAGVAAFIAAALAACTPISSAEHGGDADCVVQAPVVSTDSVAPGGELAASGPAQPCLAPVAAGTEYTIAVLQGQGQEISREAVAVDEDGAWQLNVTIPEDAASGTASIAIVDGAPLCGDDTDSSCALPESVFEIVEAAD
jgi:hypothetical protein